MKTRWMLMLDSPGSADGRRAARDADDGRQSGRLQLGPGQGLDESEQRVPELRVQRVANGGSVEQQQSDGRLIVRPAIKPGKHEHGEQNESRKRQEWNSCRDIDKRRAEPARYTSYTSRVSTGLIHQRNFMIFKRERHFTMPSCQCDPLSNDSCWQRRCGDVLLEFRISLGENVVITASGGCRLLSLSGCFFREIQRRSRDAVSFRWGCHPLNGGELCKF